jgi:hypothetical protein
MPRGTLEEMVFAIKNTGYLAGFGGFRIVDELACFVDVSDFEQEEDIVGFFDSSMSRSFLLGSGTASRACRSPRFVCLSAMRRICVEIVVDMPLRIVRWHG